MVESVLVIVKSLHAVFLCRLFIYFNQSGADRVNQAHRYRAAANKHAEPGHVHVIHTVRAN